MPKTKIVLKKSIYTRFGGYGLRDWSGLRRDSKIRILLPYADSFLPPKQKIPSVRAFSKVLFVSLILKVHAVF